MIVIGAPPSWATVRAVVLVQRTPVYA